MVRWYVALWALLALGIRMVYARRARRKKARSGTPHTRLHPCGIVSMMLWMVLIALFIFAPNLVMDHRITFSLPSSMFFQIVGLIGLTAGLWILIRAHQALGEFWALKLFLKEAHRVIDVGPYAYVRHPMYTSYFIWYAGTLLFLRNYTMVAILLMAIIGYYRMAKGEEEMLLSELGTAYEAYRRRTGMFWPKIEGQAKRQKNARANSGALDPPRLTG